MTRLLLLVAAQGAGVALTHSLSLPYRAQLTVTWVRSVELADLLTATVHLGAWLATWWLLLGTVVDLVGALVHARTASHRGAAGPRPGIAPAWVQRVVNRAVGATLVLTVAAGPAAAASQVSEAVPVQQVVSPPVPVIGSDPIGVTAPPVDPAPTANPVDPAPTANPVDPVRTPNPVDPPNTTGPGGASPTPTPAPPAVPPSTGHGPPPPDSVQSATPAGGPGVAAPAPPTAGVDSHTVAVGENLWVIARGALSGGEDRPTDRQVHAYWLRLIEANLEAETVSSGDPDLIRPGEVLTLPPPDVVVAS
ncbi:hypothetical protein [Euzebya tangerina]|uniref:hypothetical protein n=1 Tax=Euzebya tangerina TaxID=591198 RepID=UPI000E311916|nr:hypothetical protein [Euzebya tangerina]